MNDATRQAIEAATFRHLVQYLREHTEVQNIDLMNLAGFCRNCLSKWYRAAAEERGEALDYEQAREIIYGIPYREWKDQHQQQASKEQLDTYAARQPGE
ncbi:MAG: DUF1244 domain-containing protein [Gammaproteobacteria bacterium]|nr:DUF1244 domain-containing protein [Gammaproteobacteria bacterium]MCY4210961.1 DUF1244 domain-containing protein [Gammaproteobacteria bacterium]MCY4281575.1 DUF1244 domain-containing protein [Gammaproteobacteria bacterium]MCY4338852.1 DUF1244 domain-containing protein [Gammaproteobacteria bacterium]